MTYAENGKQVMLKVKALCPPGLSPCRGLVSKNDQCAADRVLGPAPGLLVTLWILWPVPSFSGLDAHICIIGSGHGSWLLYFLKGDRGGSVGDNSGKSSKRPLWGNLHVLHCPGAGSGPPWPGLSPWTHCSGAWTPGNIFAK